MEGSSALCTTISLTHRKWVKSIVPETTENILESPKRAGDSLWSRSAGPLLHRTVHHKFSKLVHLLCIGYGHPLGGSNGAEFGSERILVRAGANDRCLLHAVSCNLLQEHVRRTFRELRNLHGVRKFEARSLHERKTSHGLLQPEDQVYHRLHGPDLRHCDPFHKFWRRELVAPEALAQLILAELCVALRKRQRLVSLGVQGAELRKGGQRRTRTLGSPTELRIRVPLRLLEHDPTKDE
mmetsp:Transcript_6924/g.19112  ORF Transcript_6924/g.19112 Transcript_6924/m.19112 type:complete len:239 (+) Transcript_6924:57-773(+)